MNCIVVDDEPLARQGMQIHIAAVASLQLLNTFSNALAAGDYLRAHDVDLMFLDINMPEINGLDFIRTLQHAPLVIFTTAYPQYALESYELEAIDYLVKPIRVERFLKAVNKAESYLLLLRQSETSQLVKKIEEGFIFIRADKRYLKLHFSDILFVEGLKDYVVIYTKDTKIIASMNIKSIASQLPGHLFARVSKSYVINMMHVTSFDNEIIVIAHHEVPLGNSYRDDFMRTYVERKLIKRDP